tara:strand:- start:501 stop:1475 length:975 start_codon:yes stop_codon:yes gene_type:complete
MINLEDLGKRADYQMKSIMTPSGKRIFKKSSPKALAVTKVKQDGEDLDQTKYGSYKKRREAAREEPVAEADDAKKQQGPASSLSNKETQANKRNTSKKRRQAGKKISYEEIKARKLPANYFKQQKKRVKASVKKHGDRYDAYGRPTEHGGFDAGGHPHPAIHEGAGGKTMHHPKTGRAKWVPTEEVSKYSQLGYTHAPAVKSEAVSINKESNEHNGDNVTDKLLGVFELDEAVTGAGVKKGKIADTHIIMQLRNAQDLGGKREIAFRKGGNQHVHPNHIKAILKVHDHPSMKPDHKRQLRVAISKSHEHLKRVANAVGAKSTET